MILASEASFCGVVSGNESMHATEIFKMPKTLPRIQCFEGQSHKQSHKRSALKLQKVRGA